MSPTARSNPRDRLVHLDEPAVRELNAVAAILESLAVRRAPAFDAARRARLRAANARLRRAPDAVTAAIADCEVHALLVEPGADGEVLATLRPVRGALRTCAAKRPATAPIGTRPSTTRSSMPSRTGITRSRRSACESTSPGGSPRCSKGWPTEPIGPIAPPRLATNVPRRGPPRRRRRVHPADARAHARRRGLRRLGGRRRRRRAGRGGALGARRDRARRRDAGARRAGRHAPAARQGARACRSCC